MRPITSYEHQSKPGATGMSNGARSLLRRVRSDVGSASLLLTATLLALVWANSPWGETYDAFWHTEFALRIGAMELALDLQHWVNDGLMVFFFFVVGLEVKRELVLGELADRRRAAVPVLAALAGLVVPALVYVAFNLGGESAGAWGVVISTDTAFLLGVVALLGSACPPSLRVFLMALAIADDVGALLVIALFYTKDFAVGPLALAVLGVGLMFGLRWLQVWRGPAYLMLAAAAWVALHASGVHATLLGVTIALFTPIYAARRDEVADAGRQMRAYLQSPNPHFAHAAQLSIGRSVSSGERLQRMWQPWTNFVFVPLFALANAGVQLTGETLRAAAGSPITLGIVAGLVVGKLAGILLGTGLAVKLRLGDLPTGLRLTQLSGGAALTGIGFTISLFIVDLAFDDETLADQARVGVLAASVLATLLGVVLLRLAARHRPAGQQNVLEPVDIERDHIRGPLDAPLTLIEYGDFECPFCGRATGAVEDVSERLGSRLRYVFRHAPLTEIHPHAQLAAEAAEAAGAQGRFWQMHDRLFDAQDRLSASDLLEHAAALTLDMPRFARDLGTGRHARRVRQDIESAETSGVTGTPTFFINGRRHTGPYDADTLTSALLAYSGANASERPPRRLGPTMPLPGMTPVETPPTPEDAMSRLPQNLPETPASDGDHPRLTEAQLARLEQAGDRHPVFRGDILYRQGEPNSYFHVILFGAVAVIGSPGGSSQQVIRIHGDRRFLGELGILTGHPESGTAVVFRDGQVLRIPVAHLRTLLAKDAELRDVILRAFLVRRAMEFELTADLHILGRPNSPDIHRLQAYAHAHRLTADVVELTGGDDERLLGDLGLTGADLPLVVLRTGRVLHNPGGEEIDLTLS